MAATPRGRKPKISTQALKLGEALAFVSLASRDNGEVYQAHARFVAGWLIAFDGVIAAGHPVEEDLNCNPNTRQLSEAIGKCGKSLAITQTATGRLSIKGDNLRALINCLPESDLPPVAPDPNIAVIDDRIKRAFECVGSLVTEAGTSVIEAAILLQANSAISTDRVVAMEYWHGIDLPPNLVLPKLFAQAVLKTNKVLSGFGFSDRSVTFWFEDGAWLKTQRYSDEYPGQTIQGFFNCEMFPGPVPAGMFEAASTVGTFHPLGHVIFAEDKITSHASDEVGAQFDIADLPICGSIDSKKLAKCAPYAKLMDGMTYNDRAFFFGGEDANPIRGVVMKTSQAVEHSPETVDLNEDIPF